MKKLKVITILTTIILIAACAAKKAAMFTADLDDAVSIPLNQQFPGNADTGYDYLVNGDYLKSGIPYSLFKQAKIEEKENFLGRHGESAAIPYNYNLVLAQNGEKIVAPNCLHCHAQRMGDSLIVGLGNSLSDYTVSQDGILKMTAMALKMMGTPKQQVAAEFFLRAVSNANPYLVAQSKGVNIADRLTSVLAAHRDPGSFKWMDEEQLKVPDELIPTDVPAWWLLKKKNGMFFNGFGRGDFTRFLMASNLLTVSDTAESSEVLTHFNDVLAYIYALKPPKYPKPLNASLVEKGKKLFNANCSSCHGTYGDKGNYPNLLIPTKVVQTDEALVKSNFSNPQFIEWFKKSWFAKGNRPAQLVPFDGYIAQPLDGIWITAPYLHNGSVPNLETLLNSKLRPKYWERDFDHPQYDFDKVGWKYETRASQANKSTYNTTLKGYGNGGHTFGDYFTDKERKAVIEYLKTL